MAEELEVISRDIPVDDDIDYSELFGVGNVNMKELEEKYSVDIRTLPDCKRISGDEDGTALAANVIKAFISLIREGRTIDETTLNYVAETASSGQDVSSAFDMTVERVN